ncbi:DNA circularization N-terminal domain-containing protein, partial [Morganella morganii subsp. sibonii]
MPIIKDAISDVLGIEPDWNWSEHLQQASFRGVPFGVLSGESVFGRRQAIHEYAYRDQSWIEDMGRSNRRITIKGFLIQDSLVYDAPDVITQRDNLVAACEVGEAGTLVHPTLGEMTVSVTESGLRVSENAESGRVFEFELVVIESGLKVFAITGSEKTGELTFGQWLKEAAHTTLKTIAMIKGEVRSVTQMMKTLKQTADFWVNMVSS